MKNILLKISISVGVIALIIIFVFVQNNSITTTHYNFESHDNQINSDNQESKDIQDTQDKIIRIVQLSDLHGKEFGSENFRLISKVEELNPDIILVTGDWIDEKTTDIKSAVKTLKDLEDIAPVFYIPGNHEYWSDKITVLKETLKKYDLNIIQNEIMIMGIKDFTINILGLDEVAMSSGSDEQLELFEQLEKTDGIKIVLSHYPENYSLIGDSSYMHHKFDMMFSGHAHGGQFVIPFVGGLYAPGQGFLPEYTRGIHSNPDGRTDSKLVISRGLGNSVIPLRLFNRPEIVVVDIGE